jgi:hypothetical protein
MIFGYGEAGRVTILSVTPLPCSWANQLSSIVVVYRHYEGTKAITIDHAFYSFAKTSVSSFPAHRNQRLNHHG